MSNEATNTEEATTVSPELEALLLKGYVTKEALQDITITVEDVLNNDIANVMDSLLSTMTNMASKNGSTRYTAQMNHEFKDDVLEAIKTNLTLLGFDIKYSKDENFQYLEISWEK